MDWIEDFRDSLSDRYVLGPEIGAGGMGVVFRAEDVKHRRAVAIKVLRPAWTAPVGTQRFLREIDIASRLVHPGIVPLYDSGSVDGVLFYVMPLVDGQSLRAVLERQGELPPRRAIEIIREVSDALEYAHAAGVTHRDIKPSNILISGRHALLVDFGIAQAFEVASGAPITETEGAPGTPIYMSPEQLFGEAATARSDLYSLGCVFFELLTGHPPGRGHSPAAIAGAHVRGAADFSRLESEIPEKLRPILGRMLAADPDDRFESAADLREALARLTDSEASNGSWRLDGATPRRRRLSISLGLLAALMVAVGAVLVGPLVSGSDERRAAAAYDLGVEHLEASRLAPAEQELRQAVQLDTTNAMAKYALALTLYWRESTGELNSTSEIPPLALAAVRQSSGLPRRDSLHILAFYRFQEGAYAQARALFEDLIEEDATDVYAWLLLGIVEYKDPWLEPDGAGGFRPASNLNRALDAFSTARELQPGFHLGYGHISSVAHDVFTAVDRREAYGFHYPQEGLVAPWEDPTPTPAGLVGFLPIPLDSIVWLQRSELDDIGFDEAEAGASRLLDRALSFLRQWIQFAPDLARPREELADLLLLRRRALAPLGQRAAAEASAQVALAHADTALSLRADTTSVEFFRIARLALATSEPAEAATWLELGLASWEEEGGTRLHGSLANIPLALGREADVLGVLGAATGQTMYFTPESAPDFDDGGADETLLRLHALGGLGGPPDLLEAAFARLATIWAPSEYAPAEIRLLRQQNVAPAALALASRASARAEWRDVLDGPLWQLFDHRGVLTAEHIEQADRQNSGVPSAARTFLLGSLAKDAGEHRLAIRLFSRLDSMVHRIDQLDPGWALETRSYGLRSDSYRALGDTAAANRFGAMYQERWRAPANDSLASGGG